MARDLEVEIGLSTPLIIQGSSRTPTLFVKGIWDTGATSCVITHSLASKMGLIPTGKTKVYAVGKESLEDTYFIDIYLPNKVVIPNVRVPGCEYIVGGKDILIGMDIVSKGDMFMTHVGGQTKLTFRIPSLGGVDYVDLADKSKHKQQKQIDKKLKKEKRKQAKLARKRNRK